MADQACSHCGKLTSVRFLYELNGRIFCQDCVQQAAQDAQARGEAVSIIPLIQRSICACCHGYISDAAPSVRVGNLWVCAACADKVRDWDYPVWLKGALAALLVLLGVALVHGRKYFDAGRELYRGERLVEDKKYAEALPHLKTTLRIAPESDKGALLAAKAALLIGDVETAQAALNGHNNGKFEDGTDPQFLEVKALWSRAATAVDKANQAAKLAGQEGKDEEAAKLIHEALTYYPEAPGLAFAAETLDAAVEFDHKNYDGFLSISQKLWKEYPSAHTAAGVASAFACKYATTGDPSYRQQAEAMLEKAGQMAQGKPDSLKALEEYVPRIKYRLESRKIITKQEYDRKFKPSGAPKP